MWRDLISTNCILMCFMVNQANNRNISPEWGTRQDQILCF